MKLGKMFWISLQKLFSFLGKSHFYILDIQILWRHKMPKHKTRNIFYWITFKVNNSLINFKILKLLKFGQFAILQKKKTEKKSCNPKTSSRPFCICKELTTTSIRKWNFWSKLPIFDMHQQNYQNLSKSAHWLLQISFCRWFFEN